MPSTGCARSGACGLFTSSGAEHPAALALAQKFLTVASTHPDPNDRLVGERMIGARTHHLGDQPGARRHLERALAHHVAPDARSRISFAFRSIIA